jgi:hypothetical protein
VLFLELSLSRARDKLIVHVDIRGSVSNGEDVPHRKIAILVVDDVRAFVAIHLVNLITEPRLVYAWPRFFRQRGSKGPLVREATHFLTPFLVVVLYALTVLRF